MNDTHRQHPHVMSIDVNWEAATSGPDGEALAERIRSFVHDKFQQVALPRFIRSVQVHSFDFGTVAPELEIKDFCEPFADFYEDDDEEEEEEDKVPSAREPEVDDVNEREGRPFMMDEHEHAGSSVSSPSALRSSISLGDHLNHPAFRTGGGTPGILGGTSNLGHHHFMPPFGGLSGAQTPLAAVAGVSNWDPHAVERKDLQQEQQQQEQQDPEVDFASRPSSSAADSPPSPPSVGRIVDGGGSGSSDMDHLQLHRQQQQQQETDETLPPPPPPLPSYIREQHRPEDLQVLCRVKYSGDIRLCLTAEILLDYPMPSFVGLPLKLNVTGVTFDGVAIVAYIRRRVYFCFLSAEDADALVGPEDDDTSSSTTDHRDSVNNNHPHGLLKEIRVESEIGRKEDGKQVLKNVGKVERFVLAQVRRIFEEELVFPSFWTFLI